MKTAATHIFAFDALISNDDRRSDNLGRRAGQGRDRDDGACIYPHHPYTDAPEKGLDHTVGALSVPLRLKAVPGHYVRPGEQEIQFVVEVN